ncbi:MAG: hypothetical protein DRJ31_07500 [Candidatus Methanomethylicota archaeon]|uniref:PIN domain-containing protein n=1 Tax=Thermoproteota archaeon TaxID=2056631 RepID=A0A497EMT5_9CREN|nr:MAG: hypothetical protein DRJ31_07500 [Candidatus Verstraetearchaeota archaeon]
MYVIDASAYAPLIVSYGKALTQSLQKVKAMILDLTVYETCNAYWKLCIKLHSISKEDAKLACVTAKNIAQKIHTCALADLDIDRAIEIALKESITFYDAAYIALAQRLNAPLVSEDQDIVATAPKYDLKVIKLYDFTQKLRQFLSSSTGT